MQLKEVGFVCWPSSPFNGVLTFVQGWFRGLPSLLFRRSLGSMNRAFVRDAKKVVPEEVVDDMSDFRKHVNWAKRADCEENCHRSPARTDEVAHSSTTQDLDKESRLWWSE